MEGFLFVWCATKVEIKFVSYINPTSEDYNGGCCDGVFGNCGNKCDNRFYFCLDTPGSSSDFDQCPLGSINMGEVYANNDDFTFPVGAGAAGGIDNPYIFTMTTFTNGIRIKGIVHDNDGGNGDDQIDQYKHNIYFTPARTSSQSTWASVTITGRRSSLDIQVRGYCTTYYYGSTCSVFCRARDDTTGHYSCSSSGGKICLSGWQGTSCNQDVNECLSSPCVNGATCANGLNRFTCTCALGFYGTTCASELNECSSNPCQNGGTCQDVINGYTCSCTLDWSGNRCQTNIDECSSTPCLNSATCNDLIGGFQPS
ncbi:delta-like protein C [Anneissia japonica]|uniref:delta-like protein C n=1 Tax=Anneissia japonica TaxID=1529436 RepID=UPI0014259D5E|nr:delta-like protein C [Anneissia japonica]